MTTSAGLALPQGTLRLVQQVPDGSGTYADYRQRDLAFPEWHRIDVRAHCHLHQVEWTDALTRWHDELMQVARAATPWAWLLQGSRIHVWQEPIRPFVFALGLLSHFREQPGGEVCAVGCPKDVGEYVGELSGGSISGHRWAIRPLGCARRSWEGPTPGPHSRVGTPQAPTGLAAPYAADRSGLAGGFSWA